MWSATSGATAYGSWVSVMFVEARLLEHLADHAQVQLLVVNEQDPRLAQASRKHGQIRVGHGSEILHRERKGGKVPARGGRFGTPDPSFVRV